MGGNHFGEFFSPNYSGKHWTAPIFFPMAVLYPPVLGVLLFLAWQRRTLFPLQGRYMFLVLPSAAFIGLWGWSYAIVAVAAGINDGFVPCNLQRVASLISRQTFLLSGVGILTLRCFSLFYAFELTSIRQKASTELEFAIHPRSELLIRLRWLVSPAVLKLFATGLVAIQMVSALIEIFVTTDNHCHEVTDSQGRKSLSWAPGRFAQMELVFFVGLYAMMALFFVQKYRRFDDDVFLMRQETTLLGLVFCVAGFGWLLIKLTIHRINDEVFPFSQLWLTLTAGVIVAIELGWPLWVSYRPSVKLQNDVLKRGLSVTPALGDSSSSISRGSSTKVIHSMGVSFHIPSFSVEQVMSLSDTEDAASPPHSPRRSVGGAGRVSASGSTTSHHQRSRTESHASRFATAPRGGLSSPRSRRSSRPPASPALEAALGPASPEGSPRVGPIDDHVSFSSAPQGLPAFSQQEVDSVAADFKSLSLDLRATESPAASPRAVTRVQRYQERRVGTPPVTTSSGSRSTRAMMPMFHTLRAPFSFKRKSEQFTSQTPDPHQQRGAGRPAFLCPNQLSRKRRAPEQPRLATLLRNPTILRAFSKHLAREFAIENIVFFKEVEAFRLSCKSLPRSTLLERANAIAAKFLETGALFEVNVAFSVRMEAVEKLTISRSDPGSREALSLDMATLFDRCQSEVVSILERGSFLRFMKTKEFTELQEQSHRLASWASTLLIRTPSRQQLHGTPAHPPLRPASRPSSRAQKPRGSLSGATTTSGSTLLVPGSPSPELERARGDSALPPPGSSHSTAGGSIAITMR